MQVTHKNIDAALFANMVITGATHLSNNADKIDALNVFPVPDGDTGTNMNLSITSGATEVKKANKDSVSEVANAFAKGLLMGARGNSGVILSQIFRGFAKGLEGKEELDIDSFVTALDSGVNTAYKAVMKPVEGTILTVAKDTAHDAKEIAKQEKDIEIFLEKVVQAAKKSLKRTPDLLPVLKEVGVVDSGGQGLVVIYEGFLAGLKGEEVPQSQDETMDLDDLVNAEHHKLAQDYMSTDDIEFGYCTEFMVRFEEDKLKEQPYDEAKFREELSEHGDSLLVVSDDEIVKVHIHAEYPGDVFNLGQRFGSFISLKVENMREQHSKIVEPQQEKPKVKQPFGVVTVAMGTGLADLLKSLGATVVIQGGQTMNPSTQDIANAITEANAENVIVLPNNKNIVMAAEQAAELAEVNVAVVPTKTIPQGMAAMLSYNPENSLTDNKEAMAEASKHVKTGQITYAVRDTQIDGMTIENGHYMGLADGKIKVTNADQLTVIKSLLTDLIDPDEDEIVTVIRGQESSEEEAQAIIAFIEAEFEDVEIEVHQGDQPIYSYIFSVE
ncbi:DAK2 domain-containing protein [Gracilibacillus caseinilyticus]|uniref:DAK2 domain-containing protein n=1 Tax=Gracilibacillus caseinilyticus TaxID=2932256 RepID=A0ABY4EUG8_9BACI|nr:DAK2 domain-containing protein [Gracilibacillus caseinilyticus]UOQ47914.1 DAK2 domain-containing protein [Gracilibacillus caseinilyticus]